MRIDVDAADLFQRVVVDMPDMKMAGLGGTSSFRTRICLNKWHILSPHRVAVRCTDQANAEPMPKEEVFGRLNFDVRFVALEEPEDVREPRRRHLVVIAFF